MLIHDKPFNSVGELIAWERYVKSQRQKELNPYIWDDDGKNKKLNEYF